MAIQLLSVDLDEVKKYRHHWLHPDMSGPPIYEGDEDEGAKHLVWIHQDQIVGIASIVPDLNKIGADNIQWRLRAISLAPKLRGKGQAVNFMAAILAFAKERCMYPIYGSSKIGATGLYESLGAIIIDKPYEINSSGLHVNFLFA